LLSERRIDLSDELLWASLPPSLLQLQVKFADLKRIRQPIDRLTTEDASELKAFGFRSVQRLGTFYPRV
jgi:hypothetical protein